MKDIAARVELYGLHGAYHHAKSERSQLKKIKREKKRKKSANIRIFTLHDVSPKETDKLSLHRFTRLWHAAATQTPPQSQASSVDRASDWKARHNTDRSLIPKRNKEFFFPKVNLYSPLCVIACTKICAHSKNPQTPAAIPLFRPTKNCTYW